MASRRWKDIAERLYAYAKPSVGLRATDDDIRFAYRLLLDREPDETGWQAFRAILKARQMTPRDIAAAILGSDEFLRIAGEQVQYAQIKLPGRLMCIPTDDRDIGQAILNHHRYEPGVERALRALLKSGHCFLDVGANLGYFTLLAAALVGDTGSVHAVEPLDKNLQCLYASVEINGFRQVRVHPYAATASDHILAFTTDPGTSNAHQSANNHSNGVHLRAAGIQLDVLFANLQRVDVVKLDVEGMEPSAWQGMLQLLAHHQPSVIIEFHPQALRDNGKVQPAAFLDSLFAYGTVNILYDNGPSKPCRNPKAILEAIDGNASAMTHLNLLLEPQLRRYAECAKVDV